MKKRAAFLIPSDRMGGAERIVRMVAIEAAKSSLFDQVDIFVLCWNKSGTLNAIESYDKVSIHYTEATNELRGVFPMMRLLMRHHYSLVFSSSTHLNALLSMMRVLNLLRTDRLVTRESTVIFERKFGLRGILFRSFYLFYGGQDLVVCQTERMRQSLSRHVRRGIRRLMITLPNPIDFDRVNEGKFAPVPTSISEIPKERKKLVWCGRLMPVKSPDRAIEVLQLLHSSGDVLMHLVIVGEGPLRQSLEEKADALGLSDFVTFAGYQANPVEFMKHCDIGILTSDIEGFPNVVLEMLASGIRTVVTPDCAGGLEGLPGVVVVNSNPDVCAALSMAIREKKDATAEIVSDISAVLESRSPHYFLRSIV